MSLRDPWILLLSPLILLFVFLIRRKDAKSGFMFSSGELLSGLRDSFKLRASRNLIIIRTGALLLILLALARPQLLVEESKTHTEGIDIVLAIDCSSSMLAEDFKIGRSRLNRLEVVKDVVKDFIRRRPDDRIAMVAFAARAYTVCPLTLDHDWLLGHLDRVRIGMVEDGTAIGSAIATSLNRVKGTHTKSKVVVLLTDGRNNAGRISPITAAEAAKALGIKVYTIGAGTTGLAPYPVRDVFGRKAYQSIKIDIDEDVLERIASTTDARYFRATDAESLKEIYTQIDRLEKAPIEQKGFAEYAELFHIFLIPGLCLLLIEVVLGNTVFRTIP